MTESPWNRFRAEMPVATKFAYFDHAAVAPLSARASIAMSRWADEAAKQGDVPWPQWAAHVEECRHSFAELISADATEIALLPNTTTGINAVAQGLAWQAGDNVVMPSGEFPSNLFPWLHLEPQGVEVRRVEGGPGGEVDLNRIASACDARTRLVTMSWIGYASGYRVDVGQAAQMAHDQGALFLLDAIQGLGVFPLDVRVAPIDFLAADGHKWLLGPEGAGVFYCRKSALELLDPKNVGWNSVTHRHDFSREELVLRDEAARLEGGSQNMIGFHGLAASLSLLKEHGLASEGSLIAERVLAVTTRLCLRLEEIGARVHSLRENHCASNIVSFEIPDIPSNEARKAFIRADVIVSDRGGRLRASPHAYMDDTDIERLIEVAQNLMSDPG